MYFLLNMVSFHCYVSLLDGHDFQLSCPFNLKWTHFLLLVFVWCHFAGRPFFCTKKKHSDPRCFTRQFHWWLLEGRWLEHVSFYIDDSTLPYTTNIYIPTRSAVFESICFPNFPFGRICDMWSFPGGIMMFFTWKPRGSNCWCSSRSCQSPSELCGTTERCSVDVEEPGTIFVLCPLECWSLINKELKVVEIQLNTDLPIKISSQHFTRHWIL